MTGRFIDAHCHLDQCHDPVDTVRRAALSGVVIVAVTEAPAENTSMVAAFGDRKHVRVALGLHPLALPTLGRPGVSQFLRDLPSARYVGEVGLDFSGSDPALQRQQVRAFEEILAAPTANTSVWSVHSRRAEQEAIGVLESAKVPAVMHWFSGSKALIDRAASVGLYFSVNAAMLGSARGRSLIEAMPRDRVLTETDAPYVETTNGRRDAIDVVGVVGALARVLGCSPVRGPGGRLCKHDGDVRAHSRREGHGRPNGRRQLRAAGLDPSHPWTPPGVR